MRTWFALLKLAKQHLRGENHVHQLTVSLLWHSWLRVPAHRVLRGSGVVYHRARSSPAPLPYVRLGGGACSGTCRPPLADSTHWFEADLCPPQGSSGNLLSLRTHPPGHGSLRRSPPDLHPCLRTLRPGAV